MTPASLSWLDYSEADQRRAREIIAMFSQRESRDELGLGRIRDALSDTLFPGTSVLLTRARYFLFVPWLFREGARRGRVGSRLASWVEHRERELIGALRNGGDLDGLIGRFAGVAVQNLPSTIYWISLRRFGILRHQGTVAQVVGLRQDSHPPDDATEFLGFSDALWAPSMPDPPSNFFSFERCDFDLTRDEATWLAERIVDATPGTLLQFLVARGYRDLARSEFVWELPEISAAPGTVCEAIDEARRFSTAMHGAMLLYNVLLAERAEAMGLSEHEGRRDHYVSLLRSWCREIGATDIGSWDLNGLWALVATSGRPATLSTRYFVTEWIDRVRQGVPHDLSEDRVCREQLRKREYQQKRGQARLRNDRLMQQWGGAAGTGRLNFRWPFISPLLEDIAKARGSGCARS